MWKPQNIISLVAGILFLSNVTKAADDDVGNANDYVDEVLKNLRNEPSVVSRLDPVNIPEISESKFELRDGVIRGLSSLYRHGDCTVEYESETLRVTAEVAVRNVYVTARYRAKAGFFWISGNVEAELDHLAISLKLSSAKGNVSLESLKVAHLGDYRIKKITGLSVLLNWLLKLIANKIAQNSRGKIIDAVEGPAADALRKELLKVKFPAA